MIKLCNKIIIIQQFFLNSGLTITLKISCMYICIHKNACHPYMFVMRWIAMHHACACLYWIINAALVIPENRYELRPTDPSCSHFLNTDHLNLIWRNMEALEITKHKTWSVGSIPRSSQWRSRGGVLRGHTTPASQVITFNGHCC